MPVVRRAWAARWIRSAALTNPESNASARRTGIFPDAWATRNRRYFSLRRQRWRRARLQGRLQIRGNISRIETGLKRAKVAVVRRHLLFTPTIQLGDKGIGSAIRIATLPT